MPQSPNDFGVYPSSGSNQLADKPPPYSSFLISSDTTSINNSRNDQNPPPYQNNSLSPIDKSATTNNSQHLSNGTLNNQIRLNEATGQIPDGEASIFPILPEPFQEQTLNQTI